jgi:hypothetical protein
MADTLAKLRLGKLWLGFKHAHISTSCGEWPNGSRATCSSFSEKFKEMHFKVFKKSEQNCEVDNNEAYYRAKSQSEIRCILASAKITNLDFRIGEQ